MGADPELHCQALGPRQVTGRVSRGEQALGGPEVRGRLQHGGHLQQFRTGPGSILPCDWQGSAPCASRQGKIEMRPPHLEPGRHGGEQVEGGLEVVNMDASRHCAELFRDTGIEPFLLTVSNGGGLVTSSGGGILGPDHIDCGDICSAIFGRDTVVSVTAGNASGFRFTGWASDCSGTAPETTITMSGPRTCRANYQPFALAVSVTGSGVVTSNPAGLPAVRRAPSPRVRAPLC